jgi:hypothetical protein
MKRIIFSITCHENYECLLDLIINIKFFSRFFDSYILLSLTEDLIDNININILNNYNVRIVSIRPSDSTIWGKIDLFHQHIVNHKYTFENNIDYDYFWFVASNEYFIKHITEEFLLKNTIKSKNENYLSSKTEYERYFLDFMNTKQKGWHWYEELKKDKYTIDIFNKNKLYVSHMQHEGVVLQHSLMNELYDFYTASKINEHSTFRDYCLEEIIISSYIKSKYFETKMNPFCHIYNVHPFLMEKYDNNEYETLYHYFMNDKLIISIKPVKRIYNDPFRTFLRNKMKLFHCAS